jgi:hypothetical protein
MDKKNRELLAQLKKALQDQPPEETVKKAQAIGANLPKKDDEKDE